MPTSLLVVCPVLAALGTGLAAVLLSAWWWCAAVPAVLLAAVASYDVLQRRHSIPRNYPLLGHLRFAPGGGLVWEIGTG